MPVATRIGLKLGTDCHRSRSRHVKTSPCKTSGLRRYLLWKSSSPATAFGVAEHISSPSSWRPFQVAFAGCVSCLSESNPSLLSLCYAGGKFLKRNAFRAGRKPFPKLARQFICCGSGTTSSGGGQAEVMQSEHGWLPRACPSCHHPPTAATGFRGARREARGGREGGCLHSSTAQPGILHSWAADLCRWMAGEQASGLQQEQAHSGIFFVVVELGHSFIVMGDGVLVQQLLIGQQTAADRANW